MAKNDTILLDGIIEQRLAEGLPSNRQDEVFEYLGFEQVLKDYDLSREELESGWVDGRDDGGIDGFFTFINGHLLREPENFAWPRRSVEIQVWILTCKHHDTFQQAPLNSLHASISELFDLSLDKKHLQGAYSDALLRSRALFHLAYRRLSVARPVLSIAYAYVSRGTASAVAENVRARANQVVELTRSLFSASESRFDFIGAEHLIGLYRRTKRFSIGLPVVEFLSRGQSSYIVLTRLEDYARFVTDESGNLRRYLFDSNVRDFLGGTQVNEDILESLGGPAEPDFWWLNNGVTILATGATGVGKNIHMEDIQIVNGLQTTESIFRHFQSPTVKADGRSVLVKIIVSTEPTHRDRIIRATNNQNIVETAGLRATDKVQRDIEEYLERHGWYYERRKNYYKNIGKPSARFVTPMYLAAGYVSLVMKNPSAAAGLRSRFMRADTSYGLVFSDTTPLQLWVVITETLKHTEDLLETLRPSDSAGDRFLANWRNLVVFLCVSRVFGRYSYGVGDLARLDTGEVTDEFIDQAWRIVRDKLRPVHTSPQAKSASFVIACCETAAKAFGIDGLDAVGTKGFPRPKWSDGWKKKTNDGPNTIQSDDASPLDVVILDQVDAVLPPQPWKPGLHRLMARKLGLKAVEVSEAISTLIEQGRRHRQRDGVVYGTDGSIIARDPERT
jgi:hypothetical protein